MNQADASPRNGILQWGPPIKSVSAYHHSTTLNVCDFGKRLLEGRQILGMRAANLAGPVTTIEWFGATAFGLFNGHELCWFEERRRKISGNNIQMRSLLIENSLNEGMPFLILRGHFLRGGRRIGSLSRRIFFEWWMTFWMLFIFCMAFDVFQW